ncbi:choline-binding transcriptional repressor BetI [Falsirhodobacter sp. 20TX0035]|uniref:choline-binding transcriptional repressor BetI n=1 Tax=Falsirhodobacter sp. 20TX0035 TaxID=3022019 RepID=UPI00232E94C2|nr:transcriptional regulator BetI [Falsirhodobacter sp. 20TX0035]MDB6452178.1 transcriptional regulator BetI [Falsirhodobacter sp. 20TX0035]
MPRIGMEPVRRAALIKATLEEIGAKGTLEVTVAKIARRAGVSAALAHHYFGGKEALFLAAMRSVLAHYSGDVRAALRDVRDPRQRLSGILEASFSDTNFRPGIIGVWLNFYVLAQTVPDAKRLLTTYQRRLHSNLVSCLRPLAGDRAPAIAASAGALIDGVYLRHALRDVIPDPAASVNMVFVLIESEIKGEV